MKVAARIRLYLQTLSTHLRYREAAVLLADAIKEIDRLRLTDAEREAVECGISHILDAEYYGGQEPLAVATLRGLLERTE